MRHAATGKTHPDVYSEFAAENHFIKAVQGSLFHKFPLKWPIDQRQLKVKERDEGDVKKMKGYWLDDRYVYLVRLSLSPPE